MSEYSRNAGNPGAMKAERQAMVDRTQQRFDAGKRETARKSGEPYVTEKPMAVKEIGVEGSRQDLQNMATELAAQEQALLALRTEAAKAIDPFDAKKYNDANSKIDALKKDNDALKIKFKALHRLIAD